MKLPFGWMVRRAPPESSAVLDGRRIYVLPTKQGMLFALILFLMLTGSINYALSLGFALAFLLGSLFLVSSYHAFANLSGLKLAPGKVSPVFAGDAARFSVLLESGGTASRSIGLHAGGSESFYDVDRHAVAEFSLKTTARGWLNPGRFTVFTFHPLGLFRAWSYVELTMPCLVYPRPIESSRPVEGRESGNQGRPGPGAEDFAGLRLYRPGDALAHVAWKSAAPGKALQVKEFEEFRGGEALWLEWDSVTGDVEERLSRLTAMVLDAGGRRFGLRLPGKTIPMGQGEQQRLRALEALALFVP